MPNNLNALSKTKKMNTENKKSKAEEEIKRENAELTKMDYPASEDIYSQDKKLGHTPGNDQQEIGDNETLVEDLGKR